MNIDGEVLVMVDGEKVQGTIVEIFEDGKVKVQLRDGSSVVVPQNYIFE